MHSTGINSYVNYLRINNTRKERNRLITFLRTLSKTSTKEYLITRGEILSLSKCASDSIDIYRPNTKF